MDGANPLNAEINKFSISMWPIPPTNRLYHFVKWTNYVSRRCLASIATPKQVPRSLTICGKTYEADDWTNVTPKVLSFTERQIYRDPQNPIGLISRGLKEQFNTFDQYDYLDPVVSVEDNFDSLLIPKDHVSRSKSDTYYINKNFVLRCHTSAHQGHCLKKGSRSFLTIADVYRRDQIDATHHAVFHQAELMKLFSKKNLSSDPLNLPERTPFRQENHDLSAVEFVMKDLKSNMEKYVKRLLGNDIELRWVDAYFPFTHPSVELEILVGDEWREILGAGVVEHKLLVNHGVNDHIGWALGIGLERIAMLKYKIPDIRLFWTKDSGFSCQFENLDPWDNKEYQPISKYPPTIHDASFWIPLGFNSNDFYDIARNIGGDLVEQIKLIDDYMNKVGRRSHCYRVVYRSHERTLTIKEVTEIHEEIKRTAEKLLHVESRSNK